jgi:hypothetical protein
MIPAVIISGCRMDAIGTCTRSKGLSHEERFEDFADAVDAENSSTRRDGS